MKELFSILGKRHFTMFVCLVNVFAFLVDKLSFVDVLIVIGAVYMLMIFISETISHYLIFVIKQRDVDLQSAIDQSFHAAMKNISYYMKSDALDELTKENTLLCEELAMVKKELEQSYAQNN